MLDVVSNCMKYLLSIALLFCSFSIFGQKPTNIFGQVVDENGKPVAKIRIHFQGDTAYSDNEGNFKIAYPNPQQFSYYLNLEKEGFFPKFHSVPLSDKDIHLDNPITIRSRKAFWFNKNDFSKSDLGITVKEAIVKFKLDINECSLVDEPPRVWQGFQTELADSSPVFFAIKSFVKFESLEMKDILDYQIIGIGITDMNDKEIIIGRAHAPRNLYLQERYIKNEGLKKNQ